MHAVLHLIIQPKKNINEGLKKNRPQLAKRLIENLHDIIIYFTGLTSKKSRRAINKRFLEKVEVGRLCPTPPSTRYGVLAVYM